MENGYSDWYLPSKDELNKLHHAKKTVGNFTAGVYWSSKEYSSKEYGADFAWNQCFGDGNQVAIYKGFEWRVRPVRTF